MKLLLRLVIVLTVCFIAIAVPVMPTPVAGASPSISLSPDDGVPGTTVTVRGSNFTATEWVDIYYYLNITTRIRVREVQATPAGAFIVTFIVPESYAGAHRVFARDDAGRNASMNFTVEPGLIVSPPHGPVGTNVTVRGVGFARNERNIELRYHVNGNFSIVARNITANVTGSWHRTFPIPLSPGGPRRMDARGDDSSLAEVRDAFFEVRPEITLDKSSGSVGENITMTGTGFAAFERDITILFAGQALVTLTRADALGYWQEDFQVPKMPRGTYNVTAEGEQTEQRDIIARRFEIKPGLVLSPDEGHVGMNLTVTGSGFAANRTVVVRYEDREQGTATTNNQGRFEVRFAVPESRHGERLVTATDAAGNNATAIFTMESDPPDTPELISPAHRDRVGFVGRVMPTFEWSAVFDDSGVRYNLQIATTANVTGAGFVDPKLSIPNIVATNYTLNATEALPYGTYYWMVQAVDRAGNAGNWTAPISFRAGFMPLWGFILSIIGVVAVIGTLVYFFIIRKRKFSY